MVQLAIIEDTKSIREVLSDFFDQLVDFEVKMVASTAEDFLERKNIDQLDVVICDIGLPGKSGMEATWIIKEKYPDVRVVMFTVFEDKDKVFQSLQAGASGYLLKDTPLSKIREDVLDVLRGGAAMSPSIAKKVIEYFAFSKSETAFNQENTAALTSREMEVITKVQKGFSNRVIADELFISIDTVKFHIRNIYKKLSINSRQELQRYFNNPFEPYNPHTPL